MRQIFTVFVTRLLQELEYFITTVNRTILLLSTLLVIGLVVTVGFIFNNGMSELWKSLGLIPSTKISDVRTIVARIKPMGEVVTVTYARAITDIPVDIQPYEQPMCRQGAKYAFVVEVEAGTDLTKLQASDIILDETRGVYTISLPPPYLTNCNVYKGYPRYELSTPVFTTCNPYESDFNQLGEYLAVEQVREMAIADNILDDVKRENSESLEGFFSSITQTPVEIVYKEQSPQHASNCTPLEPSGWAKNTGENGNIYWVPK